MPEAISSLGLFVGYTTIHALARAGSAVSPESEALRRGMAEIRRSAERSQSLFGGKAATISEIWALVGECAEKGWDGADADPVNPLAAAAAENVIRALPDGVPLPDISADPDGAVSLDWIQSRSRLFSVSIGTSGRLAYAWLDGSDRGHAVARFDGEKVPRRVLDGIGEIVAHGTAAVGAL